MKTKKAEFDIVPAPMLLYKMDLDEITIGCDEFEDVYIRVTCVANMKEAKRKVREMLDHLLRTGYRF